MDFSKKYNVYAPNTRKKAKSVAEGTMYQNQLFHPYRVLCILCILCISPILCI